MRGNPRFRSFAPQALTPGPSPKGERGDNLPPLRSLWPGIVGGLLLALPGLLPSLTLDWGVDAQTARRPTKSTSSSDCPTT